MVDGLTVAELVRAGKSELITVSAGQSIDRSTQESPWGRVDGNGSIDIVAQADGESMRDDRRAEQMSSRSGATAVYRLAGLPRAARMQRGAICTDVPPVRYNKIVGSPAQRLGDQRCQTDRASTLARRPASRLVTIH